VNSPEKRNRKESEKSKGNFILPQEEVCIIEHLFQSIFTAVYQSALLYFHSGVSISSVIFSQRCINQLCNIFTAVYQSALLYFHSGVSISSVILSQRCIN
jgi:hypothetical protein